MCITTESSLARDVIVTAQTGPKIGAAAQATGAYHYYNLILTNVSYFFMLCHVEGSDYVATIVILTFVPSDKILCATIPIINDTVPSEPDEQFSVTLTSASPVGIFGESTTCVTIIDDDRKWLMRCVYSAW